MLYFFEKLGLIEEDKIEVGGVSMGGITTCALLTQHAEIKAVTCLMGNSISGKIYSAGDEEGKGKGKVCSARFNFAAKPSEPL